MKELPPAFEEAIKHIAHIHDERYQEPGTIAIRESRYEELLEIADEFGVDLKFDGEVPMDYGDIILYFKI